MKSLLVLTGCLALASVAHAAEQDNKQKEKQTQEGQTQQTQAQQNAVQGAAKAKQLNVKAKWGRTPQQIDSHNSGISKQQARQRNNQTNVSRNLPAVQSSSHVAVDPNNPNRVGKKARWGSGVGMDAEAQQKKSAKIQEQKKKQAVTKPARHQEAAAPVEKSDP